MPRRLLIFRTAEPHESSRSSAEDPRQRAELRPRRAARIPGRALFAIVAGFASACGGDIAPPTPPTLRLSSISIDGGPRVLERGTRLTLTATVLDTGGKAVSVPLVWRSSVDSIVTMGRDGVLTAGDTGVAVVIASALGVTSQGIGVHVVWQGPAKVALFHFEPPIAVTPGGQPADSIRVVVTDRFGNPVGGLVSFSVTAGGGTVSPAAPALVPVGPFGWASASWQLGPVAGANTVTATVVGADSLPLPWVENNPATFSVTSYAALAVLKGDGQTGTILTSLPIAPIVRLVDASGQPRAAIPVSFAATGNGRVANAEASTAADGSVSPGAWTLGDAVGDQQLIVTVERARILLHATATGTPVRYVTSQVATALEATCALATTKLVSCLGRAPQVGTGDAANRSAPTATAGGVQFTSLAGNGAHFCGVGTDFAAYCWGMNASVDTTGVISTSAPTRLPGSIQWLQVSPGGQHNCAVSIDHSAYCWGTNASGQLGDNGTALRVAPQQVSGGFQFRSVASGGAHTCGIMLDATAVCWGLNGSGQLGDSTTTTRLSPTGVKGGLHWKSLGAGANWTCGLAEDDRVRCWGAGIGRAVPVDFPGSPAFASLSVGAAHACALVADGTAYCWGDNRSGQLGDSTITPRSAPTKVETALRFASISAGVQHTCAVTTDGFLACWGRNTVGELGFANPQLQLTPRAVVVGVTP